MRALVLGSSGQIGRTLCEYLRSCGDSVEEFDTTLNPKFDLRIPYAINDMLPNVDFVYFLAFDVGGSRYLKDYQNTFQFVHNNMSIMTNVFDSLDRYKTPFIFASSQMSNMDYSLYGKLKSIGEHYTNCLGGLNVKFWNVYGLEYDHEKSHVITDFILSARNRGRIDMLTDGQELRQMLHAEDCSRALRILATRYETLPRNEEYHITSFEWTSILSIANFIGMEMCVPVNPSIKKDSVQLDKRNEPDTHILKYWSPKISIQEGIRKMIREL